MWFSFFAYSKFTPLPHAARRAKPWNYCLIMVLRIIFLDSKNKILKIGCRNRGFPKIQKIFFFKNVNTQNAKTSPVLNIFRRDRAQMKANMISHITCFWDFAISPQGAVESFRRKICRQNGFRGFPRTPWAGMYKVPEFASRTDGNKSTKLQLWRENKAIFVAFFHFQPIFYWF